MNEKRRREIIDQASSILSSSNAQVGNKVDPLKVANFLRIQVSENPKLKDAGISGIAYSKHGRKLIVLDPSTKDSSLGRFRFTAAHEIGHCVLHFSSESESFRMSKFGSTEVFFRSNSGLSEDSEIEAEANLFAAELLMPRKTLELVLQGQDVDENKIEELSNEFGVSKAAMTIRLSQLGYC